MANTNSNSESSKRVNPTAGGPFQFIEFINEQARKKDPKSHERTLVRSIAKKNDHLKRRTLNAAHAPSTHLRKLGKVPDPTTVIESSSRLDGESTSRDQGDSIVVRQNPPLGMLRARDRIRELANVCQCAHPDSPETALSRQQSMRSNSDGNRHARCLFSVVASPGPKNPDTGFNEVQTTYIPLCIKNETAFKSLLLVSEVRFGGFVEGHDHWSCLAINLMLECVRLVSREIGNSNREITDMMIATVINMAAVELLAGDYSKYRNHIGGLKEMARLRGGFSGHGISSSLKRFLKWISQLGGEDITSSAQGSDSFTAIPEHGEISRNSDPPHSAAPVSSDLVEVLKSIRFLTVAQNAVNNVLFEARTNYYRATCVGIQHQLESLLSNVTVASLEETFIFAAFVYVELMLLHTPLQEVHASKINTQLQEGLRKLNRAPEQLENNDLLMCISAMAAAAMSVSINQSRRASLVDRFNGVLTRLEGLSIV